MSMKPIYEYLVQKSSELKVLSKKDRFWIHALEDMTIEGDFEISKNEDVWNDYKSYHLNKDDYIFLYSKEPDKITYRGKFEVGGNILGLTRSEYKDKEQLNTKEFEIAFSTSDIVSAEQLDLSHCILSEGCFYHMFSGCTLLKETPKLPTRTLTRNCYNRMFSGCTSLKESPELPATELAPYCYSEMFDGCTSLIKAPELPAKELLFGCYEGMFINCSSLKEIKLPAKILSADCYWVMFKGCKSLTKIKLYVSSKYNKVWSRYASNWLYNVSNKGTIYKNPKLRIRIPDGWIEKSL